MQKMIDWMKSNKLATILLLILTLVFLRNIRTLSSNSASYMRTGGYAVDSMGVAQKSIGIASPIANSLRYNSGATESVSTDAPASGRKVIEESNLSVQVKNVPELIVDIKKQTESLGGFMVYSNMNRPMESSSGNITVRVPSGKADELIAHLKEKSIKIVSENIYGSDVTDQYTDNDARLATLNETKAKFEKIFAEAVKIQDILQIQNELISLQYQIDAVKGSQKLLENASSTVKITIFLSTDEFSLPYAPDNNWRPDIVYKLAVRSLVTNLRGFAEWIIWIGVYALIWLPLLAILLTTKIYWKKRQAI